MQNVKKSLSIKILASFTLLFLLLSIFANFFERRDKIQSVAAADNVDVTYTFTGSNFSSSAVVFERGNTTMPSNSIYSSVFRFSFSINPNNNNVDVSSFVYHSSGGAYGAATDNGFINAWNNPTLTDSVIVPFGSTFLRSNIIYTYVNSSNLTYSPIWFSCDSGFNSNIYKVVFGSVNSQPLSNFNGGTEVKYNYVKYIDINNKALTIVIDAYETGQGFSIDSYYSHLMFDYREYYLNDPSNFTNNESYNFGYDAGYNDGYSSGNTDGNSNGYKNGYDVGVREGYNNGYSNGVEHGGKYTFTSLLGAVVDVPVRTFTSLFNFELLGVNLAGFFSGLLTLAVILTIVKMIKGG